MGNGLSAAWNFNRSAFRLAGTVFAGGVNGVGEINGHSALKKAYEMGKGI